MGRRTVTMLLLGAGCLALWAAGTCLLAISVPLFHLLLGAGATLLLMGWARRH